MYALGDLAHQESAELDQAEEGLAAQHAVVLLRVAHVPVRCDERGQRVGYVRRFAGSQLRLVCKVPHSDAGGLLCLDVLLRLRLGVFRDDAQGDLGQRR
jgi:hypothetical protein